MPADKLCLNHIGHRNLPASRQAYVFPSIVYYVLSRIVCGTSCGSNSVVYFQELKQFSKLRHYHQPQVPLPAKKPVHRFYAVADMELFINMVDMFSYRFGA